MPTLRKTHPFQITNIWNAIKELNHQNISTDKTTLLSVLRRDNSDENWTTIIQDAMDDKLLESDKEDNGKKLLILPTTETNEGTSDWYCFECHRAGEVIICANENCGKVFHEQCVTEYSIKNFCLYKKILNNTESTLFLKEGLLEDRRSSLQNDEKIELVDWNNIDPHRNTYNKTLCLSCNLIHLDNVPLSPDELNYLFMFALDRVKGWSPQEMIFRSIRSIPFPTWINEVYLRWMAKQLIFDPMDLIVLNLKVKVKSYTNCNSFLSDFLLFKHNVGVFHGTESMEFVATEFILRDVLHELGEIIGCSDCYRNSNEQINKEWFCLPCSTPHRLVWAKQKCFPWWPAKVVKRIGNFCDVRFFGPKHERALIECSSIKPITTPLQSLKLTNNANLKKARKELELYQKLLVDQEALQLFIVKSENNGVVRKRKLHSTPKKNGKSIPSPAKAPKKEESKIASTTSLHQPVTQLKEEAKPLVNETCTDETSPEKRRMIDNDVIFISDDELTGAATNHKGRPRRMENLGSPDTSVSMDEAPASDISEQYINCSSEVEEFTKTLSAITDREAIITYAVDYMKQQIDKHNENLKTIFTTHKKEISETKRKPWCYSCERPAIYHCCWNTAYCSITCQKEHWQVEHKRICRRKR